MTNIFLCAVSGLKYHRFFYLPWKQRSSHFKVFAPLDLLGGGRSGGIACFKVLYVIKPCPQCFAQVKTAKGTDVANLKYTGGRQTLLSNGVLERAFLGAEPGELCLGALAAYGSVQGERCKVLSCQGRPCSHQHERQWPSGTDEGWQGDVCAQKSFFAMWEGSKPCSRR